MAVNAGYSADLLRLLVSWVTEYLLLLLLLCTILWSLLSDAEELRYGFSALEAGQKIIMLRTLCHVYAAD